MKITLRKLAIIANHRGVENNINILSLFFYSCSLSVTFGRMFGHPMVYILSPNEYIEAHALAEHDGVNPLGKRLRLYRR